MCITVLRNGQTTLIEQSINFYSHITFLYCVLTMCLLCVQAFLKRILQVCSIHQPPFICGCLFLISEVIYPCLHIVYFRRSDIKA